MSISNNKYRWRWWRSIRLRDAVIFTLPLLFVGFYIFIASIVDYHKIRQFDDWWSRGAKIQSFLKERVRLALNLPEVITLSLWFTSDKDDVEVIRLKVNNGEWKQWQSDDLALWGQWINATLIRGNDLHPVKIRKRGDTSIHWSTQKKSFTLKTPKSSLFKGYNRLGFSVKTVLSQYLTNELAGEFDLLSPFTTIMPVFINERFHGLYRVSEEIDESFLRRHNRMPGNIFRGDTAERGEYFKGLPRDLFSNPYIWDQVAVNNRETGDSKSVLKEFLSDLNGTTFDDHLRLMKWFDRNEIARLIALMLVIGDPYHMSSIHNQFWYEDPTSGLFHVIPWDLYLTDLERRQTKGEVNKFLREALRNPFILDSAFHVLYQKLKEDQLLRTSEQLVKNINKRYANYFRYEGLRRGVIPGVDSPDDVLHTLQRNVWLLGKWFKDSVIAFHAETHATNMLILDFEARGHVGSDLYAMEMDGNLGLLKSIRLMADRNRNGVLDSGDIERPGEWEVTSSGGRLVLNTSEALLPGFDSEKPGIQTSPIPYRFFITTSSNTMNRITAIRANLRNRLSGETVNTIHWEASSPVSPTTSWHPWQYPLPSHIEHRLSGKIHLRKTLIIEEGETLIIDAGTTVRMDPDVSILARGRVIARGSADRPIVFVPAVKKQPWGTIALQGSGANESVFEYVRFIGGGGALLNRTEYLGMVSINWVDKVLLRHCYFTDNVRSDDTVHAVHANIAIQDSVFLRANSDAIDFDYASGEISNCRFENSGNDAIDLMTSGPRVVGNYIKGSGDKGISIGEASHPFVFNNYITESSIGVEVKDRSEPYLLNNVITKNKTGIKESMKNWRYGHGGWAKIIRSIIRDNETDFSIDKNSELTKVDSVFDPMNRTAVSGAPDSREADDLNWIFTHYGISKTSDTMGLLDNWMEVKATEPRVSATFEDNFDEILDGWFTAGGVSRLEKRDQNLWMSINKRDGYISRTVNWDLTDTGFTYMAIFELTGSNLKSATFSLLSDGGEITRPFKSPDDLSLYTFLAIELKPAHYKSIKITAEPASGAGRIKLHTYRLYAIPKGKKMVSAEHSYAFRKHLSGVKGDN